MCAGKNLRGVIRFLRAGELGRSSGWRAGSSSSLSHRQVLDIDGQRPPRDPGDRAQGSRRVGSTLPGDRQVVRDEVGVVGVGPHGDAP